MSLRLATPSPWIWVDPFEWRRWLFGIAHSLATRRSKIVWWGVCCNSQMKTTPCSGRNASNTVRPIINSMSEKKISSISVPFPFFFNTDHLDTLMHSIQHFCYHPRNCTNFLNYSLFFFPFCHRPTTHHLLLLQHFSLSAMTNTHNHKGV